MIYIRNGKRFNIYAGGVIDGVRYANFTSEEVQRKLGIVAVPVPAPPAEYDPRGWTVNEIDDEPYVVYAKKDDKQLKWEQRERLLVMIEQREATEMMPRFLREVLMSLPGVEQRPGFAKVKQLDDDIAAARAEIAAITAEVGPRELL